VRLKVTVRSGDQTVAKTIALVLKRPARG